MADIGSPPQIDLQGASRMTGGILRGRAHGNVFNFADATTTIEDQGPVMGKVHVYREHEDPKMSKPYMTMKHEVTTNLAPVLEGLASNYSPIKSKPLFFMFFEET
jgi:hypothetical protein